MISRKSSLAQVICLTETPSLGESIEVLFGAAGRAVNVSQNQDQVFRVINRHGAAVILLVDIHCELGRATLKRARLIEERMRPYVILISHADALGELLRELSIGGDDFVLLSSDYLELVARLTVAERAVELRIEQLEQVSALETLCRRHSLLGEFIRSQCSKEAKPALASEQTRTRGGTTVGELLAEEDLPSGFAQSSPTALALSEVSESFGLKRVQVASALERVPEQTSEVARGGIISMNPPTWTVMQVSGEMTSLRSLYSCMVGDTPDSDQEALDALAEYLNNIQGILKTTMLEQRQEVLTTLIPDTSPRSVLRCGIAPAAMRENFVVSCANLEIAFSRIDVRVQLQSKIVRELECGDILVEPPRAEGKLGAPLLNPGTILTRQNIRKLRWVRDSSGQELHSLVVTPPFRAASPLTYGL